MIAGYFVIEKDAVSDEFSIIDELFYLNNWELFCERIKLPAFRRIRDLIVMALYPNGKVLYNEIYN